jgi:hypothetical protein
MTPQAGLPLSRQISSPLTIWLLSLFAGLTVFGLAVFTQWLIYDDWMHDSGPLRLVGSFLAGGLMFAAAFRWQVSIRERRLELLHRFEKIRWMNDRIRNSLQAIECVTYASSPEATESVRAAVDTIEAVLLEVLTGAKPPAGQQSAAESNPESLTAR